jgi:hypothetical protein
MAITNAAANLIATALNGGTITPYTNANCYVGVGDSTTAFAATQTALQGTTNVYLQQCDAGFPTLTGGNVFTYQITVPAASANFAWNEFGIFNGSTNGTGDTMFVRFLSAQGTKPNTQQWQLTVTVTLQAA